MSPTFRPYEVVPGWPIHIDVVAADGTRTAVVGIVDRVPELAGDKVMRMVVTQATLTPLDPEKVARRRRT